MAGHSSALLAPLSCVAQLANALVSLPQSSHLASHVPAASRPRCRCPPRLPRPPPVGADPARATGAPWLTSRPSVLSVGGVNGGGVRLWRLNNGEYLWPRSITKARASTTVGYPTRRPAQRLRVARPPPRVGSASIHVRGPDIDRIEGTGPFPGAQSKFAQGSAITGRLALFKLNRASRADPPVHGPRRAPLILILILILILDLVGLGV